MKYKISCMLCVTIINLLCTICQCCTSWKEIPEEAIYQCYQPIPKSVEKCQSAVSNVTLVNINREDGTIDVEFDYDSNCEYELKLYFWKYATNETECAKQSALTSQSVKYTIYKYYGTTDLKMKANLPACTKRGLIKLKYLTTRCYYIQFQSNPDLMPYIRNIFLDFHLKSYKFNDFNLIASTQLTNDMTLIMNIQHPFIKKQPNIGLRLQYFNNSTNIFPEQHLIPYTKPDGAVAYKLCNSSLSNIINCIGKQDDKFECRIKGLVEENYTITFTLRNLIQCPIFGGPWESCSKIYKIEPPVSLLDSQPVRTPEVQNRLIWIILGIVSGTVLFSVVFAFIYKYKINQKRPTKPEEHLYKNIKIVNKILLLYPRDADVVMETLKALRKALQAEGFTVYDIYDQDQQNALNEKNEQWIIDKFKETDLTILVRTYCGEILTKNMNSAELLYKKPCWKDTIFSFALSFIMKNNQKHINYSVVCVGLKKINYSFPFDSSTIYELPYQSEILVKHLRNADCTLHSCNEWNEFKCICDKMKCSTIDIDYLDEILNGVYKLNLKNVESSLKTESQKDYIYIV